MSDDTSKVTLDSYGYFHRDGRRILPVGVNYWPGSCGVEMWQAWPEDEMRHDLDVVRDLGMNCIRFFLRWPDFEPEAGVYREVMFQRLDQFLGWCAERDLLAHPALVVGFMSGGLFWPPFKQDRNLYSDPLMIECCAAYCRKAAQVIARHRDTLLAVDFGNELNVPSDSSAASPAAVRQWSATMSAAIRAGCPGALVVSGTDSGPIFHDSGWRIGDQPGTDFFSVHTYPVPTWNVVPFDGMTDPLCQAILPFNVRLARLFGPAMVQEFSTILMLGEPECTAYLRGVLPACRDAGANGFLWWCLRDIRATVPPYSKAGFEGRLGFVDDQDRVKPGLAYAGEFFRSLRDWQPAAPRACAVALYWPRHWYRKDEPDNPGNDPTSMYRRMLIAHFLLTASGREVGVVRGGEAIDPSVQTLVVTGAALDNAEMTALAEWTRRGGRVLWSAPTWAQWTPACGAMIGAQPVDLRAPRTIDVERYGQRWPLTRFPNDGRLAVRATSAAVLAADPDGYPVLLANRLGQGKVICAVPAVEDTILDVAADRPARDRWAVWYRGVLTDLESL